MIQEVAIGVSFELTKTVALEVTIRLRKINLVLISYDLSLRLSFERHFDDVS